MNNLDTLKSLEIIHRIIDTDIERYFDEGNEMTKILEIRRKAAISYNFPKSEKEQTEAKYVLIWCNEEIKSLLSIF